MQKSVHKTQCHINHREPPYFFTFMKEVLAVYRFSQYFLGPLVLQFAGIYISYSNFVLH